MYRDKGEALPGFLADLLDEVRCESISFLSATYTAPWRVEISAQPEARGYLIESGNAELEVRGFAPIRLGAGDLAHVSPELPHSFAGFDGEPVSVGQALYRIDRLRAAPLLRILPPMFVLRSEGGLMSPWVRPLADLLFALRYSDDPVTMGVLRRVAEACIIRSMQQFLQHEMALRPEAFTSDLVRIGPALQAMLRRPEANWSVSALAREAGLSRTVFATLFAASMGEGPGHYLARIRMARGEELLRAGQLSIAEIAVRTGYRTEVAFGRAFKRHAGTPPAAFRKQQVRQPGSYD